MNFSVRLRSFPIMSQNHKDNFLRCVARFLKSPIGGVKSDDAKMKLTNKR